tara:strand:+ start:663 stop:1211 length:549 start_codon:yes stop_codon:yes gene_type:complete
MKGLKYKLSVALLLIGNTSVAQEVTPEVQELVNKLAADGFKEFRLEDGPFTQLRLIAEIDGQALELILDPNTQEVIKTRVSFDDNGDGKISRNERRRGISFEELPENASERARVAVKHAREQKKIRDEERQKNKEKSKSISNSSDKTKVNKKPSKAVSADKPKASSKPSKASKPNKQSKPKK